MSEEETETAVAAGEKGPAPRGRDHQTCNISLSIGGLASGRGHSGFLSLPGERDIL